jgi:SEC-C motif
VTIQRNDPCPCGSGAKYKRCCLDKELEIQRLLPQLEQVVHDIGDETWDREPEWFADRMSEFYAGGIDAFGMLGPTRAELLTAELWFLLDCPLPSGETPIALRRRQHPGRITEMLARSTLRAWRVLSAGPGSGFTALCALGTGRARIEAVSTVSGELRRGAVVVGRSVSLGPERWALIGTARVVEPSVSGEFGALLSSLDAPRGEEWRVHGGVVAAAAWAWPEERVVTIDGEVVEGSCVRYLVTEPDEVRSRLEADPELTWRGESDDDGALMWQWRWDAPAPRPPLAERGVRYELCDEDAAEEPYLVEVDFDPYRDELWLFAPTPERLALARRLMRDRLGSRLAAVISFDVEPPECMPRWKRLRLDTVGGRRLAAARARAAA